jgi:hypothetical protein
VYVTDRLAFVQLQKTGCSHITRVIEMIHPGEQLDMHGRIPKWVIGSDRLIAGSVRNPWDWYVSLWGYGCDGRGSLYEKLTGKVSFRGHGYRRDLLGGLRFLARDLTRDRDYWKELYSDVDSPRLFREWLTSLLSTSMGGDLRDDFNRSSLQEFAGLYTFRYCYLFHDSTEHLFDGTVGTPQALRIEDARHNIVQFVIRMESMEEGIMEMFQTCGIKISGDEEARIREMGRTNPSSRRRDNAFYYDRDTAELVRRRESLIIDSYRYDPPL